MTQHSTATITPAIERVAPRAPTLRQRYWWWRNQLRRRWHDSVADARLRRLRKRACAQPRFTPGRVTFAGVSIAYDDLLSLVAEYTYIFRWGIYDFAPRTPRPLVIDCGAHIGTSVLRFKQLAPDARIVAFEPDPAIVPLLEENIRTNGLRDVEIVRAALALERGEAAFHAAGDSGTLVSDPAGGAATCAVPTEPLSAYLREPVAFLKMNIEGAECAVLREAAEQLHNVRQMVVEYHGFPECGQNLHTILGLLHEKGFRYVVHHFDYASNPALRPPFRIDGDTRFFALVAATRCDRDVPAVVKDG